MGASTLQLLIVEDDRSMARLLFEEFQDEGYAVRVAYGGDDALRQIQSARPDVVVLDINMPGKDGIETLNQIAALDRALPVILHTAYSAYRENFMTWSAIDYVVKSSDLSALKQAVASAVAGKF